MKTDGFTGRLSFQKHFEHSFGSAGGNSNNSYFVFYSVNWMPVTVLILLNDLIGQSMHLFPETLPYYVSSGMSAGVSW